MNTALFAKTNGVFPYAYDGTTDFTGQNGLLLAPSGTAGLLVLNTSTTVPAVAVVLDGNGPSGTGTNSTFGVLGGIPPVRLLAHGTINKGQRVQQDATSGIVVDAGAGSQRVVVGVALESGVAGQYIMVQTLAPAPLNTW